MTTQDALQPLWPILVVDNEENQLVALDITLRSAGYNNLRMCSDSRKVMSMLTAERFSLVILDLNMPHVTGLEVIQQSAVLENRPPIVVVTASTLIKDYADGAAGGVTDYLVKPVDREQLLAVVHRVLADSSVTHRVKLTRNYLLSDRIKKGSGSRDSSASENIIDMLEQTKSEYRRVIGSLPTPYLLLEEDSCRVRYCNDAFLRFLDTDSAATVTQLRFPDMLDGGGKDQLAGLLKEKRVLLNQELRGRTPAGRDFVIVGTFRLSADDGLIEGGFVDVTGSRRLEQDLARVRKLETVGRLAAGLAHDFNNTLMVVSAAAELITLEQGVTTPITERVEEIRLAVARASKMVRQLLSIGRVPQEDRECVNLNGVLREAESSLRYHLRAGQTLVFSLEADDPIVCVAVTQVDQVVRNLIRNASDAMPGGGTITVTTRNVSDSSSSGNPASVFLEIKDTGTGMDKETLARIFEPFFTTKRVSEGTGLGLSMVEMIIEAAGGRIAAESVPGSGTLFRIVLPLAIESEKSIAREDRLEPPEMAEAHQRGT